MAPRTGKRATSSAATITAIAHGARPPPRTSRSTATADAATRTRLARYGMAIGVAFQHADDRDDNEWVEHAPRAAARIRELGGEAHGIAQALDSATLAAIAAWFSSKS